MKRFTIALIIASLTGCATSGANYRPVVDLKGRDPANYEQNLRECQQYALQVAGAADSAAAGAVAGAIFGVALAAIGGGGGSSYRKAAAGVGALSGAASGAMAGERDQRSIISRCLAGRGFNVLN